MASLTDAEVRSAIARATRSGRDIWLTDEERARGVGRFRVRAMPTGSVYLYFRFADTEGRQRHLKIGEYHSRGRGGLTLKDARAKANALSSRYQGGERDLHEIIPHEKAVELQAVRKAQQDQAEADRRAKAGSLRALLIAYVGHLEHLGKASAQDVRNIIRRNVLDEFPALADTGAAKITRADCTTILSKLIERGAGRTAAKLRAYGRAAYALAMQADADPTVSTALHGFSLEVNPWATVPAKSFAKYNGARTRALSWPELQAYMQGLSRLPPGATRSALWLALLLGGQRPTQLLRVSPAHLDLHGLRITLHDGKGARARPRAHALPLTEWAATIARDALAQVEAAFGRSVPWVFTTNGRVPIRVETLTQSVLTIAREMVGARISREPFDLRDIRRSCETLLADMGVSRDIRAQVLSHGLGGVQMRHYDQHDYSSEKRAALTAWADRLSALAGLPDQSRKG